MEKAKTAFNHYRKSLDFKTAARESSEGNKEHVTGDQEETGR